MEEKNNKAPKFYYFDIDKEFKENQKHSFRTSLLRFLKYFLSALAVFVISVYVFDLRINFKGWLIACIIMVVIFFLDAKRYYKELKSLMDIITHIRDIKASKTNARGNLKHFINTYNMSMDREKLKLDLLKSFSPIPIFIFIFGIIFSANSDIVNKFLNTSDPLTLGIFSLKTIVLLIIIFSIIIYIFNIFKAWDRYKFLQFRGLQYQNAYDELKEKGD